MSLRSCAKQRRLNPIHNGHRPARPDDPIFSLKLKWITRMKRVMTEFLVGKRETAYNDLAKLVNVYKIA
jgi:hypothetical protein